jgi:hypothetical protein
MGGCSIVQLELVGMHAKIAISGHKHPLSETCVDTIHANTKSASRAIRFLYTMLVQRALIACDKIAYGPSSQPHLVDDPPPT